MKILKTSLFILSGVILALGLIVGISLLSSTRIMVANVVLPFQLLGIESISSLVAPMLSGFLINLAVLILILALIFSALLYSNARLIGRIVQLEARLSRLEAEQDKTAE